MADLPEWNDEREAHLRAIADEATGELVHQPAVGGPAFTLWMRELFAEVDRLRAELEERRDDADRIAIEIGEQFDRRWE